MYDNNKYIYIKIEENILRLIATYTLGNNIQHVNTLNKKMQG